MSITRRVVWMIAMFGLIAVHVTAVLACECVEFSQKKAFQVAAAVFRGKVQQIEHVFLVQVIDPTTGKSDMRPPATGDGTVVTFKVHAAWKGAVRPTIKVYATARGTVCPGYVFQENGEYVIYAAELQNRNWDLLQPFAKGMHVYDIPDCPLRVRTDVEEESKLLGKTQRIK